MSDSVRVDFRRRWRSNGGRGRRSGAQRAGLDGLLSLDLEHLPSVASPQALPIPSLDLDGSASVLAIQSISLAPEVCPNGSLDLQGRKVLRNPQVDDESLDAANAAEEVKSAGDVVKEHRVAFRPSLLMGERHHLHCFVEEEVIALFGYSALEFLEVLLPPPLDVTDGTNLSCLKSSTER